MRTLLGDYRANIKSLLDRFRTGNINLLAEAIDYTTMAMISAYQTSDDPVTTTAAKAGILLLNLKIIRDGANSFRGHDIREKAYQVIKALMLFELSIDGLKYTFNTLSEEATEQVYAFIPR